MAITIAQLKAIIEADVSGLKTGLSQVEGSFEKIKGVVKKFEIETTTALKAVETANNRVEISSRKVEEAEARRVVAALRLTDAERRKAAALKAYSDTAGENVAVNNRLIMAEANLEVRKAALEVSTARLNAEIKNQSTLQTELTNATTRLAKAEEGLAIATRLANEELERMNATASKMKMTELINSIFKGQTGLQQFSNSLKNVQSSMTSIGAGMTATLTVPIFKLGETLFEAATKTESYKAMLTAVTHSVATAANQFNILKEASKLPGVTFEGLLKGSVALQSLKLSFGESLGMMKAFGNELAKFGGGAEEFQKTVVNIQQLVGQKSLSGQELRQWATWIPSIRKALIDLYGTADTKALSKAGVAGITVLRDLTAYFAQSGQAADTAKNQIKNLQNEFFILASEVGKDLLPIVLQWGKSLVQTLKNVTEAWNSLSPSTKQTIIDLTAIAALIGPIILAASGLVAAIRGVIGIFTALRTIFALVVVGTQILTGELSLAAVAATASWAAILAPITAIVAGIGLVVGAVYALKVGFDYLTGSIVKSREEINREYEAYLKNTQAKMTNNSESAKLITQYESLAKKTIHTKEETARMQTILNQIADRTPAYITGYDKMGNALGLVADAYKAVTKNAKEAAEAMRIGNVVNQYSDQLTDAIQKKQDLQDQINKLQQRGYFTGYHDGQPTYSGPTSIGIGPEFDNWNKEIRTLNQQLRDTEAQIKSIQEAASKAFHPDKNTDLPSGIIGHKIDLSGTGKTKKTHFDNSGYKPYKVDLSDTQDMFGFSKKEVDSTFDAFDKALAKTNQIAAQAEDPFFTYIKALGLTARQYEILNKEAPEYANTLTSMFQKNKEAGALVESIYGTFDFVGDSLKQANETIKERNELYNSMFDNYRRQITLSGDASEADKALYEMMYGDLQKLDDQQKEVILGMAQVVDVKNKQKEAEEAYQKTLSNFDPIGFVLEDFMDQYGPSLKKLNDFMEDMRERVFRLKGGFEDWAVSMGFTREDIRLLGDDLKKAFELDQTLQLFESFASGVKDIFRQMLTDISEKGFKGLFANIYSGFKELLLKMAIEYLTSQLYNLLLRSLGHFIPGLGDIFAGAVTSTTKSGGGKFQGGQVYPGSIYMVGERGREAFVPSISGTIVPADKTNDMLSALGYKHEYGAGSTVNHYGRNMTSSNVNSFSNSNQTISGDTYHVTVNVGAGANPQQIRTSVHAGITDAKMLADRTQKRYA